MARPFESMRPALTRLGPPPETARREVLLIHGVWGGAWVWEGLAQDLAAEATGSTSSSSLAMAKTAGTCRR